MQNAAGARRERLPRTHLSRKVNPSVLFISQHTASESLPARHVMAKHIRITCPWAAGKRETHTRDCYVRIKLSRCNSAFGDMLMSSTCRTHNYEAWSLVNW